MPTTLEVVDAAHNMIAGLAMRVEEPACVPTSASGTLANPDMLL